MFLRAVTGLLAALLAVFVYRSGHVARYHFLTTPDLPAAYYAGGNVSTHCTLIQDPSSDDLRFCEDIVFWDHHDAQGALTDRFVLIGCDPNRQAWNTVMGPLRDPSPRGHLFLYDTRTHVLERLALAGYPADHDFHPIGMDVYPSSNSSPSNVFVVNHARAQTTIEQLVLDPTAGALKEARYVRTLRSPHFVSPNALAMTGPTRFWVSNDHRMTRRLPHLAGSVLPVLESLGALPLSWVAHVDVGADGEIEHVLAAQGIPFANGIAIAPDGAHVAVAATSIGRVYVYATVAGGAGGAGGAPALAFSHAIAVPFLPDNVAYDDDGALIVAGHPQFGALVRVAANETGAMAPSWAISIAQPSARSATSMGEDARAPLSASKLVPEATSAYGIETLFQSDGSVFGSSSTTLRDSRTGTIYVAGLYERGILACQPQAEHTDHTEI